MHTLYLNPETWDLSLDAYGNIAYAKDPYSKAQDVASAIKLFRGELYYNTEKGIPYFDETFNKKQSLALYRKRLQDAALSVPGVVSATSNIKNENRTVTGDVTFTDKNGQTLSVAL